MSGILSACYGVVCALDRARYRAGLSRVRTLPRPVISVGNLAAGGGGKTPLVAWLARSLEQQGYSVVILSRGYGRRGQDAVRVVPTGDPVRDSASFGDEPLMLAGAVSGGRVYVGRDRFLSGSLAFQEGAVDVYLLDDGFQHRALARDFDVLVVDDRRRFGNGRLLPAGILREPVWRLAHADAVVVTKSSVPDPDFTAAMRRFAPIPVFWAGMRAAVARRIPGNATSAPAALQGKPLVAFSGIADPVSFDETLRATGLRVVETVHFKDHHPYTAAEAAGLEARAMRVGAEALVTTAKDAARWPGETSIPCYALEVELFFHDGTDGFMGIVTEAMAKGRAARG